MRTRREQLTASQLMRKNPTQAIVDKDNHLRGALKYILLSLPSPSEKPQSRERDEIIREAFATGNHGFNYAKKMGGRREREKRKTNSGPFGPL